MPLLVHRASLVDVRGTDSDGWVLVDGEVIIATGVGETWRSHPLLSEGAATDVERIDVDGAWLAPGFIDLHLHGGGGHAFDDGLAAIEAGLVSHRRHGTTRAVVSLVSAPVSRLTWLLIEVSDLAAVDPLVLGSHLEGPFLAPTRRGAHDLAVLTDPGSDGVEQLLAAAAGTLRQITIAPELPGALAAIDRFVEAGVVVAIGHTEADYRQSTAAFASGATVLTHAYNAMPGIGHRSPGPVLAAIDTADVVLELINDGEHVAAPVVALTLGAAPGRVAFVSDAMAAAAADDGDYLLGSQQVTVRDGVALLTGTDTLAGSTLSLDAAVRRAISDGVAPDVAIGAVTSAPARALGLRDRFGELSAGYAADLVVLDAGWQVQRVFAAGAEIPR